VPVLVQIIGNLSNSLRIVTVVGRECGQVERRTGVSREF